MKLLSTCLLTLLCVVCLVVSTSKADDVVLSLSNTGALALSPDSRLLALATDEGTVLINTQWQSVVTTLPNKSGVTAIAWNKKGNLLATGSANGVVQLWNVEKRQPLASFSAKGQPLSCLAWSNDNTYLATGTTKGAIFLWNTNTYKLANALLAHTQAIVSLAWHNAALVSAGKDNNIIRWNAEQSTPVDKVSLPYTATALAWNPDGVRLLLGTEKGAFIYNSATKGEIAIAHSAGRAVISVAWSTTGEYAATVDATGAVSFWPESVISEVRPLYVSPIEPPTLAFSHPSTIISSSRQEVILHDLSFTTPAPLAEMVLQPSLSLAPQPATKTSVAQISLPQSSLVHFALIDQHGRELVVLHDGRLPQGNSSFALDVAGLASGVYYLTAQSALYHLITPCVVVR